MATVLPIGECTVRLKRPHPKQAAFLASPRSRKMIKAGRRSGKTTVLSILAVQRFPAGGAGAVFFAHGGTNYAILAGSLARAL